MKSVVKLQCSTEGRKTTYDSRYRGVRRIEGLRNRDFTLGILIVMLSFFSFFFFIPGAVSQ